MQDGTLPKLGKTTLEACRIAYIRSLREAAAGRGGTAGGELAEQRARLAREQADAAAIKNAEARAELIPAEEIEPWAVALLSGVKTRIRAVPPKVTPLVYAAETKAEILGIIVEAIDEALEEIAEAGKALPIPE